MSTDGSSDKPTNSEWRKTTVGDCAVINADAYSPKEAWPFINYLDTGSITQNLVYGIQCLTPGVDKIPARARRKVEHGDIVYSTVRPNQKHYGVIKDIPDNFLASTGFAVIRAKQGLADTGFIYYFLTQAHIVEYLHIIAEESVTAYPAIRPSDIERLELSLPPLPTQRAIAGVLGAFDDKIALNAKMNATLEAMARALFRSWFVDFEPVRAKRSGRWRRGETLPGMPAALYDAFPAELTPTDLGDAPLGWEARAWGRTSDVGIRLAPTRRRSQIRQSQHRRRKRPGTWTIRFLQRKVCAARFLRQAQAQRRGCAKRRCAALQRRRQNWAQNILRQGLPACRLRR